jgi:hypothetical protein
LKHFREIEADLQGLDPESWHFLKAELLPLLTRRDARRGWQPLLDKLNEAKGYNHLTALGCENVRFIPRSTIQGQKTPDLQGFLAPTKLLCEVKTINPSDDELACRNGGGVRSLPLELPVQFFNKLRSTLELARDQMAAYSPGADTRKIAYVVINYDDILHQFADNYSRQLEGFAATKPVAELEVFFHVKPAFYWAMR